MTQERVDRYRLFPWSLTIFVAIASSFSKLVLRTRPSLSVDGRSAHVLGPHSCAALRCPPMGEETVRVEHFQSDVEGCCTHLGEETAS